MQANNPREAAVIDIKAEGKNNPSESFQNTNWHFHEAKENYFDRHGVEAKRMNEAAHMKELGFPAQSEILNAEVRVSKDRHLQQREPNTCSNTPEDGVNPAGDAKSMRAPCDSAPPSGAPPKTEVDPKTGEITITTVGTMKERSGLFSPEVDYSQKDKFAPSGSLIERDIAFSGPNGNGYLLYFKNPEGGSPMWAHVKNMVTKPAGDGTFDTTLAIANGSQVVIKSRDGQVLKWTRTCTFLCS